jgi:hypothetical protein
MIDCYDNNSKINNILTLIFELNWSFILSIIRLKCTCNFSELAQLSHLNTTTYECSIGTLLLIKPTQSIGATGIIPMTKMII